LICLAAVVLSGGGKAFLLSPPKDVELESFMAKVFKEKPEGASEWRPLPKRQIKGIVRLVQLTAIRLETLI
jgi:hypothetical protein